VQTGTASEASPSLDTKCASSFSGSTGADSGPPADNPAQALPRRIGQWEGIEVAASEMDRESDRTDTPGSVAERGPLAVTYRSHIHWHVAVLDENASMDDEHSQRIAQNILTFLTNAMDASALEPETFRRYVRRLVCEKPHDWNGLASTESSSLEASERLGRSLNDTLAPSS
jgi:hypothetical protein